MKRIPQTLRHAALLAALCVPLMTIAQTKEVDPKADDVLRAMTTYMAGLKHFSVKAESTVEVVTTDGEKIQFIAPANLTVSRPDKLYADRKGDLVNQNFYYNGKTLTLYDVNSKSYATVPAPATVDAMLDFARDKLDVIAPGADLFDTRAYQQLNQDVKSGRYVGLAVVDGQRCHHIAYRGADVDWQLWVREGKQPLPCKYIVTTRDMTSAPQFSIRMSNWNLAAAAAASTFQFKPPAGAKPVDFMPLPAAKR